MLISRSSRLAASGKRFLIFSPPIAPSTTTWPTWIPSLAYSFAIACARAEPSLGRIERAIACASPERRTCPGKQQCANGFRNHATDRLTPEQETAETHDAPALLKVVGLHIDDFTWRVVARIVDGQLEITAGLIEQRDNVGFLGSICNEGSGASARGDNVGHNGIERRFGPPGDENIETLGRKPFAELRTESLIRPDTDHDCCSHSRHSRIDWKDTDTFI
jgi:hypothetical protein